MARLGAARLSPTASAALRHALAVGSSAALLAGMGALEAHFQGVVFSVFIATTALIVLALGAGPGLLATGLTGLGIWYFFQRAESPFGASDRELARLVAYFVASLTVIYAIERLHRTRRRLEQTLLEQRRTAAKLRALSEAMPQLVFIARADGRSEYVNQKWMEYTGADEAAASRRSAIAFVHPDDVEDVRSRWAEAIAADAPRQAELRYRARDGSYRWFHVSVAPLKGAGDDTPRWMGTATDVHERKVAERRFRLVLEASPMGAVLVDTSGRVAYANDAFLKMVGYTREQLDSGELHWDGITPPEHAEKDRLAMEQALTAGASDLYEKEYFRRDGSRVPVLLACAALGEGQLAAFTLDLTERRLVEAQARTLASVVQNSNDFIALYTPELRPVFVSDAGRRMLGLGDRDVRETRLLDYFWPDDHARIENEAVPRLTAEGRWSGEARFRSFATGEPIYTIWNAFVVRDEFGNPAGFATISPDLTPLKRAEQQLRESEERLRRLIENVHEYAIFMLDPDGRVATWNAGAQEMKGWSADEILGQHFARFYPPDAVAAGRPQEVLEHAEHTGRVEDEGWRLRKDGSRFWANVVITALRDDQDRLRGFTKITRDFTARRRMEETLRRREAEFRQLAEAMPQFVWITRTDGHQEYFNRRWYEYTGTTLEETRGDLWTRYLHPDDVERALSRWRRCVSTGEPFEIEYRFRRASDGAYRWFLGRAVPLREESGAITRWFGTCTDIHDQKQAQAESFRAERAVRAANAELRASELRLRGTASALQRANERLRTNEERYRLVSQATHDVIWDWDLTNDDVIWSEAVEATFGYALAEIPRGPPWRYDQLHPEDRERIVAGIAAALEDPAQSSWSAEYRFRHRDGHWIDVLDRGLIARDDRGRGVRVIGSMLDLTERKRTEQALREANARLLDIDQRKNDFLAVLSHELRNPLSPIRNSVYVLDRAVPGSPQAGRALAVIDRQVHHMTRLIDDLLDVTRISRGKVRLQREPVELGNLLRRTAEDHRSLFVGTGIALELDVRDEQALVNGDSTRLSQVVGNLLANAAKFTPQGGRVTLSLRTDDQQAVVRVVDTGPGISEELLGRLFEPFVQAESTLDRSKGGLGLGLALVRGLVELHGGSVGVATLGSGQGAEFTVRLPLASEPERRRHLLDPSPVTGDARRVLVIEDNLDAADSLKEALELGGHEVEVAHEGAEGIDKARSFHPDVVLCDIGLPGIDGYQVARRMRSDPQLREVPLVALSGYALPEDLERAREAGFVRHLAKPPDLAVLERTLAEASAARQS